MKNFIDQYMSTFKKYVDFKGRARRREFWTFYFMNVIAMTVLMIFFAILASIFRSPGMFMVGYVIDVLLYIAILLPSLAVSVRRLQDTGSKWTKLFMGLIPIAGAIILIIAFCKEGQQGDNEFGPDPKAAN